MKRNQLQVFAVLFLALGTVTWLSTACGTGNNPAGSGFGTPTPTPVNAQTIWANGNTGAFFSQNVGPVLFYSSILNVSTPDPISGDNTTLQFSATAVATPVNAYYLSVAPENPGTYYASGHLQFDIKLNQTGQTGNFQVGYGYQTAASGGTTTNTTISISATTLSTTVFTHESIPLASFGANSPLVVEPFYIIGPAGGTTPPPQPNAGPIFTIDNVQWTSN
jgi:hypothetical protein